MAEGRRNVSRACVGFGNPLLLASRLVVVRDERVDSGAVVVVEEREVVAARPVDAVDRADQRVLKVSVAVAVEFETHHTDARGLPSRRDSREYSTIYHTRSTRATYACT